MTGSTPASPRALVLDGQYCHALAAVRSLGRRGIEVVVASHKPRAMSFASRHCAGRIACPSPVLERAAFKEWLLDTLRRERFDATLCREATAEILSLQRDRVQKATGCPYRRARSSGGHRKDRVTRLAGQLGVPVPATHELERLEDAAALASTLAFPVIVKGVHSSGSQQVEMVHEPAKLVQTVQRLAALRRDHSLPLPIIQEYVQGRGYGVTALMRRGEPIVASCTGVSASTTSPRRAARAWGHWRAERLRARAGTVGSDFAAALCWDESRWSNSAQPARRALLPDRDQSTFRRQPRAAIAQESICPGCISRWRAGRAPVAVRTAIASDCVIAGCSRKTSPKSSRTRSDTRSARFRSCARTRAAICRYATRGRTGARCATRCGGRANTCAAVPSRRQQGRCRYREKSRSCRRILRLRPWSTNC